jgi:hypothetical protein
MAAKKKKVTEPRMRCPFTGKQIELVCSDNIYWMAKGPFWNTKLYKSKQELLHDLSHRNGVAPDFPREEPKIEVRTVEEPQQNPNADLVVRPEDIDEKAIDRIVGDN